MSERKCLNRVPDLERAHDDPPTKLCNAPADYATVRGSGAWLCAPCLASLTLKAAEEVRQAEWVAKEKEKALQQLLAAQPISR